MKRQRKPSLNVQTFSNLVQFGLRVAVNRDSIGKVLTQQFDRVLIASSLPRAARIAEYPWTSVAIENALTCHLRAAIPGDRSAQRAA